MIHFDMTLCDNRVIATEVVALTDPADVGWQVMLVDVVKGTTHNLRLTPKEWRALYTLIMFNDEPDDGFGLSEWVEECQEIIEPRLIDCPSECRPIP